jgi:hypothetical protein
MTSKVADTYFVTPTQTIRDILYGADLINDRLLNVLEPAAGNGAIVKVLLHRDDFSFIITAVERDPAIFPLSLSEHPRVHYYNQDFLSDTVACGFDLIITNPPYNQFYEFLRKAITLLNFQGKAVFLLRLSLLTGIRRSEQLLEHRPSDIYCLCRRPNFGWNQYDACPYGWCIWEKNPPTLPTRFHWLDACGLKKTGPKPKKKRNDADD